MPDDNHNPTTSQESSVGSESFRTVPHSSESFGTIPNDAESFRKFRNASERKATREDDSESAPEEVKSFRQEIMDLKITNRAKDMFIEQLQKEREGFAAERAGYVEKLMGFNRKVGELEAALHQLRSGNPGKDSHSSTTSG